MKKSGSILLLLSALALFSCAKVEELKTKVDELDARVLALEEAVTSVNDNAVAIQNLMDESIVITEFKELEYGYEMSLNSGLTIKVSYGAQMPCIVPIIGVNGKGQWIMSIDGGQTFSVIAKADGPFSGAGATPSVKVDANGYWTISYDGGRTYERILDDKGLPMSAVDGRELAGKYAFFLNVTVDGNLMTFHLITGESVTVPVNPSSNIVLDGYVPKETIFMGGTLSYKCTVTNVASAVWTSIPEGWSAYFGTDEMSFTAPSSGVTAGEYSFKLLAFSEEGLAKEFEYVFTFDENVFFDDFNEGDIPDPQYWELCKRKYTTGYSMYMSESYDNTYLENGKLVMIADKVGGEYWSSGIQTKFGFEKCRIEVNCKFVKMSHGAVNAVWLFPFSRYIWPKGGEVDIFEHLNDNDDLWCTCHTHYSVNLGFDENDKHLKVAINKNLFNTYAIDLTEEAVIFYINGREVFRYGNKHLDNEAEMWQYPFWKSDFYLLLDTCLGMEWPGAINDEELPARMEVDWVKISKLD